MSNINIEDVLSPYTEPEEEPKTKKKSLLFPFLNDLYHDKKYIFNEDTESEYNSYMINRYMSANLDTAMYAQEMNEKHFLEKKLQHDFYFYAVRPNKRYSKWIKSPKQEDVELLMEYYNYNRQRAEEVLHLHSEDDLEYIRKRTDKGGK